MGIETNLALQSKITVNADGSLLLEVPYTDDRELIQDISAWLPHVEVILPNSLRAKLSEILSASLDKNSAKKKYITQ